LATAKRRIARVRESIEARLSKESEGS